VTAFLLDEQCPWPPLLIDGSTRCARTRDQTATTRIPLSKGLRIQFQRKGTYTIRLNNNARTVAAFSKDLAREVVITGLLGSNSVKYSAAARKPDKLPKTQCDPGIHRTPQA
jgi:hypothetical protein